MISDRGKNFCDTQVSIQFPLFLAISAVFESSDSNFIIVQKSQFDFPVRVSVNSFLHFIDMKFFSEVFDQGFINLL